MSGTTKPPPGPQLPVNGLPRRVILPAAERFQHEGITFNVPNTSYSQREQEQAEDVGEGAGEGVQEQPGENSEKLLALCDSSQQEEEEEEEELEEWEDLRDSESSSAASEDPPSHEGVPPPPPQKQRNCTWSRCQGKAEAAKTLKPLQSSSQSFSQSFSFDQQPLDWGVDSERLAPKQGAQGTACSPSFHRLLVELSREHRRALARLRGELENGGQTARASSRTSEVSGSPRALPQSDMSPAVTTVTVNLPAQWSGKLSGDSQRQQWLRERQGRRGHGQKKALKPVFSSLELGDMPPTLNNSARLSPFDFCVDGSERTPADSRGKLLRLLGWQHSMPSDTSFQEGRRTNFCRSIVTNEAFDFVSSILIILNSIIQGWAANYAVGAAIRGEPVDSTPIMFQVLTLAFTFVFLVELLLRLYAHGLHNRQERAWNIFDSVIVTSDVVHSMIELLALKSGGSAASENFTVVRMLRVFRITRAIRVVRLFRFFRELRMMMYSVLRSGSSLLWSCVLLCFTIYAFAVYFMQILAYTLSHYESGRYGGLGLAEIEELKEKFGNLARAEYSLYLAISGGISWGEISGLFLQIHEVHGMVFCVFVFFTTFAVLNIITGIFVESAMNSARSNQEEVVQEQMHATAGLLAEMKNIFQDADQNADGSISLPEFEMYLDRKEVRAYLDALGVGMEKAKGLFELLDLDMSGEITVEEFAFGCLRLKGWAKSIDLATLMNHSRRMAGQFRRFFTWSENQFKHLHEFEARVDELLALFSEPDLSAKPTESADSRRAVD